MGLSAGVSMAWHPRSGDGTPAVHSLDSPGHTLTCGPSTASSVNRG